MTTVVKIEGLSKRFVIRKEKSLKERLVNFRRSNAHKDDFWALRGVDLTIDAGQTIGLIGPNGSGKSTLLKMIGGILQPTSGTVQLRGRLAALLELGAGFHPDLTGRENVYLNASILGLSREQTDGFFDAIVDFSGIEPFIDTQVKFYSSGMYVRLAFAVAVHVDPDLLLVDEVLAVGDEPFQRKCIDRIRTFQREGRTIVLVTHALDQVAELCDRAVVLEHGEIQVDGDPHEALRVLRHDFEQTREADERKTVTVSAPPAVQVTAVELLTKQGTAVSVIDPTEDLVAQVHVSATTHLDDWSVGLAVNTAAGQNLLGTNTTMLGIDLSPLDGETTVTFSLTGLHLGDGSYVAQAFVADADGVELHRLADGPHFEVRTDGRTLGPAWAQVTADVE